MLAIPLCQRENKRVFPLSKKVKVLDLRKEKKLYADVTKIYSTNESFIHEIVKKYKEIHASLPPTSNFKSYGHRTWSMLMKEEELNVENLNRN